MENKIFFFTPYKYCKLSTNNSKQVTSNKWSTDKSNHDILSTDNSDHGSSRSKDNSTNVIKFCKKGNNVRNTNFQIELQHPEDNREDLCDQLKNKSLEKKDVPLLIDDIRSAALALTSLSLSPVTTLPSSDVTTHDGSPAQRYFTFPPGNTDKMPECTTNGDTLTQSWDDKITKYDKMTNSSCPNDVASDDNIGVMSDYITSSLDPSVESKDSKVRAVKSRSFSYRDYYHDQKEVLHKPRSYSFDSFGRAGNYQNTCAPIGSGGAHESSMIHHKLGATLCDEGFGSTGSSESFDQLPTKRKLNNRTLFRCMWRGCDRELTSLAGIILHVRHQHIGLSNAGEEEFYFDDVNIDSNGTSGISSSEESLQEFPKTKYRKSYQTDETINQSKHSSSTIFSLNSRSSPVIKNINKNDDDVTNAICANNKSFEEKQNFYKFKSDFCKPTVKLKPKENENNTSTLPLVHIPNATYSSVKYTPLHHSTNYLSPKNETCLKNINFMTMDHPTNTRIFMPSTKTMTQQRRRRGKGRKKCRKVYGMNNKQSWCTQCRWKKACIRFT